MRWRTCKGMLLGGSALAAVSMADRLFAQEPGVSPPVSPPQSPAAPLPGGTPPPPRRLDLRHRRPPSRCRPHAQSQSRSRPPVSRPRQTRPLSPQRRHPLHQRPTRPALPMSAAGQMTVSGEDINARPMTRSGEVVEAAPGLIAIEHSEAGKANQYYLRGWNGCCGRPGLCAPSVRFRIRCQRAGATHRKGHAG
jgi:hypothetical protein